MEERTFISGISELIDNVGKCKCYDDSRILLNSFIIERVGIRYEIENGTAYRNSNNPKDVKKEALRVIDDYFRNRQVIDEVSTAGLNTGRKIMDKNGAIYDDGTLIGVFGNIRNKIERAKAFIDEWRRESAPILKEEKTVRLRPKQGADKYIESMFLQLKELGNIDEQAIIAPWSYLCGMTDEIPETRIKWTGGLFNLNVLVERFLIKDTYFKAPKGAVAFICSLMVDENGNEIKPSSLKTTKNREFGRNAKRADEVWQSMKLTGLL